MMDDMDTNDDFPEADVTEDEFDAMMDEADPVTVISWRPADAPLYTLDVSSGGGQARGVARRGTTVDHSPGSVAQLTDA